MNFRKTLKVCALLTLAVLALGLCSCKKDSLSTKGTPFYDKDNQIICRQESADPAKWKFEDKGLRSYISYVVDEASALIAKTDNCSPEEAKKKLFEGNLAVYTNFDRSAYEGLKKAYENNPTDVEYSYGGAVSDISGGLVALYSQNTSDEDYADYSVKKHSPYGVLTPLCIYAPVLETNTFNWSSPASEDGILLVDSLRSHNVEADVAILKEYGIKNSLDFMKTKFGIELSLGDDDSSAEKLAKGDVSEKFSPVQLVEAYQFLANGGYIYELKSVKEICDAKSNILYKTEEVNQKVTERATADILNRLLQSAITQGSVDSSAYCDNVSAGGKSGSGSDGSWFVGFTPQYVCAVWHGSQLNYNGAVELFSLAVSEFDNDFSLSYPGAQNVKAAVYCAESGLRAGDNCNKTELGYYESSSLPKLCDKH